MHESIGTFVRRPSWSYPTGLSNPTGMSSVPTRLWGGPQGTLIHA